MPSSTQPQSLVATSSAIAACRRYHYAYKGDDATNVSFQYCSNTDQCRPSLSLGRCFSSRLDDTVGTCRETRRKLAEGIGGLSRVCRELTESDRELTRKASGVRWKKTKRLPGRSSNVVEKLIEVRRVLLDLLVTMVVIN
ncbi:hypothetical protein BHE74_00050782 [Ensete ventricosum]|nr:hypothetical protein BHE74_00050782 [Ensete ventricosum]RZS07371.1 hypothetical protein BHM03_00038214 [Ensete ventricosum]